MLNKVILILIALSICCCTTKKEVRKPNIILFLADDLGYGEVGIYGQDKIQTPNIDALAENGMLFTQHYSGAPVCAPARNVLLTGKHTGHTFIRGNDPWKERAPVWNYENAFLNTEFEGQLPIPSNTITIANQLKKGGYTTSLFGKWGLGAPNSEGTPNRQGFDYFFGYNCQRQAHNLYPAHLWENENKVLQNNKFIAPHVKLDSTKNPYKEENYKEFRQLEYAPEKIHQQALSFLDSHKDSTFFMYYASPLPHLPLQAPKEYVEKYRTLFGHEKPYTGDGGYFPNRYPRATYAAMIDYLDHQLGELITKLKELNIYDNTVIVFTSDNGPTYTGGVDFDFFNSSKPFSNGYGRTKGFVHEGGLRVPLIVSWPNRINPKSQSNHISAFYDIMPTILEIAEIESPKNIDGISFKSALLGKKQEKHQYLYWEFPSYNGQQAVRLGNWKGIRKDIFEENLNIQLFDLKNDIHESFDISKKHPQIVKQIENIMKIEHHPSKNERFKFKQLGDL